VREKDLRGIWYESDLFNAFRGTDWMPDPCRSYDMKEMDFGGCRCQAFALTGDASTADPVCHKSEHRYAIDAFLAGEAPGTGPVERGSGTTQDKQI